MLGGLLFRLVRLLEFITLVPIMGMLASFVNLYVNANQLTPNYILVLFIVSVLAVAWALVTGLKVDSVRRNAPFVALIDLGFVAALIVGVWYLRYITNYDCINLSGGISGQSGSATTSGGVTTIVYPTIDFSPFGLSVNSTCTMLKASFAFGIINVVLFFTTAMLAVMLHRREKAVVVEKTYSMRGSHSSR